MVASAFLQVPPEQFEQGGLSIKTDIFVPLPFFKASAWDGVKLEGSQGLTCAGSDDLITVTCVPANAGSYNLKISPSLNP
jgi:hypothetical protein